MTQEALEWFDDAHTGFKIFMLIVMTISIFIYALSLHLCEIGQLEGTMNTTYCY